MRTAVDVAVDPLGRFVATADVEGEIRLWDLRGVLPPFVLRGPPGIRSLEFSIDGSRLEALAREDGNCVSSVWAVSGDSPRFLRRFNLGGTGWGWRRWDDAGRRVARWGPDLKYRVWSTDRPIDAEPLVLLRGDNMQLDSLSFSPRGDWLATADLAGLAVWPLSRQFPIVIRQHDLDVNGMGFAPDGGWIASSSGDGTVRVLPLEGDPPPPGRVLLELQRMDNGFGSFAGRRTYSGRHQWGGYTTSTV